MRPRTSSVRPNGQAPEALKGPQTIGQASKHPSDIHADSALTHLIEAYNERDSVVKDRHVRIAEVYATLSLRDAILEWTATLRDLRERKAA